MERIIAHLDMDAFFAAVEERDHEWLAGKPIVVGADPQDGRGRGVVSTANYKAREYGIRSAMPITRAWQFSEKAKKEGMPEAVFLSPNFERYEKAANAIFAIVRNFVPLVEEASPPKFSEGKLERASIDEAYIDLSFTESFERADELAKKIKKEIRASERLTCSIGIGPNKLIAKIASDMQKPDGLTIVKAKDAEAFLGPLAIRKIPGIGPKTETEFLRKNVRLVSDLKKYSREALEEMMGKWGIELYEKIRGRDDSPVTEEYETKSIGEQETFAHDTFDPGFVIERLNALAESVLLRLEANGFQEFRTLVLTVRFENFETVSRSKTLSEPTRSLDQLRFQALKLLMPFFEQKENPKRRKIRLIGVRMEKLR